MQALRHACLGLSASILLACALETDFVAVRPADPDGGSSCAGGGSVWWGVPWSEQDGSLQAASDAGPPPSDIEEPASFDAGELSALPQPPPSEPCDLFADCPPD